MCVCIRVLLLAPVTLLTVPHPQQQVGHHPYVKVKSHAEQIQEHLVVLLTLEFGTLSSLKTGDFSRIFLLSGCSLLVAHEHRNHWYGN
jgi:hypothetical protein